MNTTWQEQSLFLWFWCCLLMRITRRMCVSDTFLLAFLQDGDCMFDLASFLHVCRRYDPKLQQCLTAAVEGLRPFLAKGMYDYFIYFLTAV